MNVLLILSFNMSWARTTKLEVIQSPLKVRYSLSFLEGWGVGGRKKLCYFIRRCYNIINHRM